MSEPSLFDGRDDGEGPRKDRRLRSQLVRVYESMLYRQWMTLKELAEETGDPEGSISARIRDLRKDRFGGFTVEQKPGSGGTHYYRLRSESGNPVLVYQPSSEPRSAKKTAKAHVRMWLNGGTPSVGMLPSSVRNSIEELLK